MRNPDGGSGSRGVQGFANLADNDFGAARIQAVQPSVCELRECADPDARHELSPSPPIFLPQGARNRGGQRPSGREDVQVSLDAIPCGQLDAGRMISWAIPIALAPVASEVRKLTAS